MPTPAAHSTPSISADVEPIAKAKGGFVLPSKDHFLERAYLFELLRRERQTMEGIPEGTKENEFYIINNATNMHRRKNNLCCLYADDCGAWTRGATNLVLFICDDDKMIEVITKNSLYGIPFEMRVKGGRHSRKRVFTPLSKQPLPHEIIHLHRAYAKHKHDESYRRRISWMDDKPVAVVEYLGTFPRFGPLERSQQPKKRSRRKKRVKLEGIKGNVPAQTTSKAKRNRAATKANVGGVHPKKKIEIGRGALERQKTKTLAAANLADRTETLQNMAQTNEFVQEVHISKDKGPCIILYTADQMEDVRRFCCAPPDAQTTVLGVDRTFTLGDLHVTMTVFKNLAVTRRDNNEHPIFPGPLFLHAKTDYLAYHSFFSHISARLRGTPSQPIFGTDDEVALKQAIQTSFPQSSAISCTRHLQQNVDEHLRDNIGVSEADRSAIIASIFGPDGITRAADQTTFEFLLQTTIVTYKAIAPSFDDYFTSTVIPLLRTNFATTMSSRCSPPLVNWTNAKCESMNAVKRCTNWKAKPLDDLVSKLYGVIKTHYQVVKRALVGEGAYVLCPQFAGFAMPANAWNRLPHRRRDDHYNRFQKHTAKITPEAIAATASNGEKKQEQMKRKRRTKTIGMPKKVKVEMVMQASTDMAD